MYELPYIERVPEAAKMPTAHIVSSTIERLVPEITNFPHREILAQLIKVQEKATIEPVQPSKNETDSETAKAVLSVLQKTGLVSPAEEQIVKFEQYEPSKSTSLKETDTLAANDELTLLENIAAIPNEPFETEEPQLIDALVVSPEWVAILPEPVAEHVQFAALFEIPLPAAPEVINSIIVAHPEEIPALPTICVEVMEVMNELEPEPAAAAEEMLLGISEMVDEVLVKRMEGDEIASELEQTLEKLCIELFEYLGIEYTPETFIEFTMGMVKTKRFMAFLETQSKAWIDKSMREALPGSQQTNVFQLILPFTQQLGSLTLRLSQALAA